MLGARQKRFKNPCAFGDFLCPFGNSKDEDPLPTTNLVGGNRAIRNTVRRTAQLGGVLADLFCDCDGIAMDFSAKRDGFCDGFCGGFFCLVFS